MLNANVHFKKELKCIEPWNPEVKRPILSTDDILKIFFQEGNLSFWGTNNSDNVCIFCYRKKLSIVSAIHNWLSWNGYLIQCLWCVMFIGDFSGVGFLSHSKQLNITIAKQHLLDGHIFQFVYWKNRIWVFEVVICLLPDMATIFLQFSVHKRLLGSKQGAETS